MDPRADRFPLMDSLRAIAALCVLGAHAGAFTGAYLGESTLGIYIARLEVGVPIFFLISGFLLYRPFVKARLRGRPLPHAGAYAWRRFLRIAPPYWVALTAIALWLGLGGVFTADGVPTFYGFGQTLRADTIGGGLPQAWSICVEVAFYAFLPLWAWLIRRAPGPVVRSELLGLGALFAISIAYKGWQAGVTWDEPIRFTPELVALPAYWDQFALGMGIALLSVTLEGRPLPRPLELIDRHPWALWLAALGALIACGAILKSDEFFAGYSGEQILVRHGLYTVTAICMLLPVVFGTRGWLRQRLLASRPLLWLGLISYGIFLYNVAALSQLERWGYGDVAPIHPYIGWAVAGVAATVPLAALSYYVVERPALSLKRLVGREPREAAEGEAIAESAPATPARVG